MKQAIHLLAAAALLSVAHSGSAADYQKVRERAESLVDSDTPITIAETPVDGFLQVQVGSEIIYMSDDARYLMQGRMLDLETREDLTNSAKGAVRRELIKSLDQDDLIRFSPEDPDYELIVFTDVDCGYCRRLHGQIDAYNDAGIAINYAAYPRAGIGSKVAKKMTSVWCADDPQEAMNIAKSGKMPPKAECDAPIAEEYKLGKALGVTGTPALVTRNGDLIPGYVAPEDLRQRMARLAKQQQAE